jgi:hypothetical protein
VISKEQAETLFFMFFTQREPNAVKTISAHTKSTFLVLGPLKKHSSRDTIPLRKLSKDGSHMHGTQPMKS